MLFISHCEPIIQGLIMLWDINKKVYLRTSKSRNIMEGFLLYDTTYLSIHWFLKYSSEDCQALLTFCIQGLITCLKPLTAPYCLQDAVWTGWHANPFTIRLLYLLLWTSCCMYQMLLFLVICLSYLPFKVQPKQRHREPLLPFVLSLPKYNPSLELYPLLS